MKEIDFLKDTNYKTHVRSDLNSLIPTHQVLDFEFAGGKNLHIKNILGPDGFINKQTYKEKNNFNSVEIL